MPTPRQRANSKRELLWAERRREAVNLRRGGASYAAIGKRLGVSRPRAFRLIQRELGRIRKEAGEDAMAVRTMELERLDAMTVTLWPKVMEGDLMATDRMLRVMERRAKLCALDEADWVVGEGTVAKMAAAVELAYRGLGIVRPMIGVANDKVRSMIGTTGGNNR